MEVDPLLCDFQKAWTEYRLLFNGVQKLVRRRNLEFEVSQASVQRILEVDLNRSVDKGVQGVPLVQGAEIFRGPDF